jgi:hypothetical protein
MFGFGRQGGFSTLIWVSLIMVPDTIERHQQRMLSFVARSYLAYRQEVDYKGSTMLYSAQ